jgi:hypothetical protein
MKLIKNQVQINLIKTGGDSMELEDISAEVRWKIATKTAQSLFIDYGLAFWTEGGKEIKAIADSLKLPTENTIEVGDAWRIIRMILMGEWEYKTLEETDDHVVDCLTNCPMLNMRKETCTPVLNMPHLCQAYSKSAIEALNPKFTHRFTKRMCAGDDYCESIVELKK